jgi:arsenate reductase (thioredoxin)
MSHYNILFLSNKNTARSIFAEAVTNRLGRERFRGFSAGMKPAAELDRCVVDILRLSRYPTEGLRPKSWTDFITANAPRLDFVFTLCDLEAGEPPPHWPGRPITADWRYPDPDRVDGEDWERRKQLSETLAGLERQLGAFMFLSSQSLDGMSLRPRLDALRQGADAH